MITIEEIMLVYQEVDDPSKASRIITPKLRRLLATDVAQLLLVLLDELEGEELVTTIIKDLDNMPINYFDTLLEFDARLAELYV